MINERENRPAPKRHFSAADVPVIPLKLASVPQPTTGKVGRPSMMPKPRFSSATGGRPSYLPSSSSQSGSAKENMKIKTEPVAADLSSGSGMGIGLSEKEIDERVILFSIAAHISSQYSCILQISKAVEAEVTRRMAEREKLEEEERQRKREERESESPRKALLAGGLTPLLKRHRDLDDELSNRLKELERR